MKIKKIVLSVILSAAFVMLLTIPVYAYDNPFGWLKSIIDFVEKITNNPNNFDFYDKYTRTSSIVIGDWTYTLYEDYGITAENKDGATVSVIIDTSEAFELSRNYEGGAVEYSVIRENHWHDYDDIAEFYPLYDGVMVNSETDIIDLKDYYATPTANGVYSVRIAIYEDDDWEYGEELLSTNKVPYYLAMIPVTDKMITYYGYNELYNMEAPSTIKYSELYKAGFNQDVLANYSDFYAIYDSDDYNKFIEMYNSDKEKYKYSCLVLMNDIVLNPIVVRADGTVVSSRYTVYQSKPLGYNGITESGVEWAESFDGAILGNGHTIYGFYSTKDIQRKISSYCNGNDAYGSCSGGLVSVLGSYGYIADVNMDNFVIDNNYAGAFAGLISQKGKYGVSLKNCNAIHGTVSANISGGGIVGAVLGMIDYDDAVSGNKDTVISKLTVDSCTSGATVTTNRYSGGIAGKVVCSELNMSNCINYGKVQGTKAGGMAAEIDALNADGEYKFYNCKNFGVITGTADAAGGIVGEMNFPANAKKAKISSCVNFNDIVCSNCKGEIVGNNDVGYYEIDYCVYREGYRIMPNDDPDAYGILSLNRATSSENPAAFCEIYGHTENPVWSTGTKPTCEEDGTMVNLCLCCGKAIPGKVQVIPATGHCFYGSTCIYCGTSVTGYSGTVLANPNSMLFVVIVTAAVLGIALVAVIITNKRRKSANAAK